MSIEISTVLSFPSPASSSCDIFQFDLIDPSTGLTPLSLARPGVVPPVLEPTGDTASSGNARGGMEAGAGCHRVLAGLGNRHKRTNFMLLPEAISSRTVSNAGKYPVGHYVSDSSSGMKAATFISLSLSRINRT